MASERWHEIMDRAVDRAERLLRDTRRDYVHSDLADSLARDVIELATTYPQGLKIDGDDTSYVPVHWEDAIDDDPNYREEVG